MARDKPLCYFKQMQGGGQTERGVASLTLWPHSHATSTLHESTYTCIRILTTQKQTKPDRTVKNLEATNTYQQTSSICL